jgi:hypothetical protein
VPTKEVVWMHSLLSCLEHPQLNPTPLLSNNQIHIVQEKQLIGKINMSYVSSEHQIVDIFTKGLLAINVQ